MTVSVTEGLKQSRDAEETDAGACPPVKSDHAPHEACHGSSATACNALRIAPGIEYHRSRIAPAASCFREFCGKSCGLKCYVMGKSVKAATGLPFAASTKSGIALEYEILSGPEPSPAEATVMVTSVPETVANVPLYSKPK